MRERRRRRRRRERRRRGRRKEALAHRFDFRGVTLHLKINKR